MPLLLACCGTSRSALPAGSDLPTVSSAVAGDAYGFMWKRALWLVVKQKRLHGSGTLKNASIVVTHVSAEGFCEEKLCCSLVSEERASKLPNPDT